MKTEKTLDILCQTTDEEKVKRFEHINRVFMGKYFDLVWLARADKDDLLMREMYEVLKKIKEIESKFKDDVKELDECETDWQHGFNSGVLAYSRFLDSYIKDELWPLEETGGVDFPDEEIREINGSKYVHFDGREHAEELFPELDT